MRDRSDTILVGRVNYEGFLSYWPRVKDDQKASRDDVELSRWLDDVAKVVFSRTLREVTWKNARLATGGAAEEVAALKRAPGKDIIIQNSTRLTQSLLAAGLLDEALWHTALPNIIAVVVACWWWARPRAVRTHRLAYRPRIETSAGRAELTRFDDGVFVARYDVKERSTPTK